VIFNQASLLLTDRNAYAAMASTANPYGDGTAAVKTVARLLETAST
jgi:UDP-N-acetylglucosamine 2-epimerase